MALVAPPLPPGRHLKLGRRGTTFIREVEGPAGAPTLFLLHGWTATADLNWFRCYAPLGRHYNVVAIDHRGHGRGIRTRRPFSLADCADDVAAVCEKLDLDHIIPVGYSMGGPIAQLVWRRHSDIVDGLVLCATSRNFGKAPRQRVMFSTLFGLSAAARVTPKRLREAVSERLVMSRVEGYLGEWVAEELRLNDPATVLGAGWSIGAFSSHQWVHKIDVPTSVVITEADNVVPRQRQEKLAAAIPGAQAFRIRAGHDACVAGTQRFVPALLSACDSVRRRARTPSPTSR